MLNIQQTLSLIKFHVYEFSHIDRFSLFFSFYLSRELCGWYPEIVCAWYTAFIQVLLRRYEFNEVSLRCLASRCIAQHKIAYKDVVPKQLEMYIEMHSAEKI